MWHHSQSEHSLIICIYLVCQVRSSAGDPSEASERWSSMQRRERCTEGGAASSGCAPLSGARLWLPTAPHTAPPAARHSCESSTASRTARRISPPPTPPPCRTSSPVFPVASSGVGWTCAAECGPVSMTGPGGDVEDEEDGACWWSKIHFIDITCLTCKNCAKDWASLGFFFSNKVRRQDSTEASVVLSGAFCSVCVSKKVLCNSCWKTSYLSAEFCLQSKLKHFLISCLLPYYQLYVWLNTKVQNNNDDLENSVWYALWPQLLEEQEELQLSSDVRRNLKRRVIMSEDFSPHFTTQHCLLCKYCHTCSSVHFSNTWSQNQASLCGLPTDSHLQNTQALNQ